jgi:putative MFS transporter
LHATNLPTAASLTDTLNRQPLTMLHVFVLIACGLGFSFDMAEIAFGNILSAVFSAPGSPVNAQQLAWLLSSVYVGAIAGAPLLGWLADLYGKRLILLVAMVLLTIMSLAAAANPGPAPLIIFRGLAGLSLGAYPPLMFAFLTDVLPPKRRGPLSMAAVAAGYIGPTLIIFMVRWLTPIVPFGVEGWRWAFIIGGVGAAICAIMFVLMPESPRWLIGKGRLREAASAIDAYSRSRTLAARDRDEVSVTPSSDKTISLVPAEYRRRLAFLMVAYFLTPWATVGFSLLAGAVLVQKGINVQDSLFYVGVSTFGPFIGTLIGGLVIDRIQRRTALVLNAVAMAVVGLVFGATDLPLWLMVTGLLFNLLTSFFLPVLILYASEMFPTAQRAGAVSWSWAANRVGSALVPLLLLPLLHGAGAVAMFAVIATTLAGFVTLLLLVGPKGQAGRAVD